MGKFANDTIMDAALGVIASANLLIICTSQPTTRANAISSGVTSTPLTPGLGGASFTLANGDTSGRKVTIAQQANMNVASTGTVTHIALIDGTNLLYVTTCTSQLLTVGNTVATSPWSVTISDPV